MRLAVLTLDRRQSPRQTVSWVPILSHRVDDESRCSPYPPLHVEKNEAVGGIPELLKKNELQIYLVIY